jgi:predicted dehydrogenase
MGYDRDLDGDVFVLSHARAFELHSEFELIGAVDFDRSKRSDFESQYQVKAFKNINDALYSLSPTIVVVATPSADHCETVDQVLKLHTPKVIVCEKPIDEDIEKAKRLVKLCAKSGVQLFVNYMRRSESGVNEVKKMIDNNVIKKPIKAVVWYSKGLLNNGSHMLNLMEYWLGEASDFSNLTFNRYWNETDPEVDFRVDFEKGSAIFLSGWEEFYPHLSVELLSPSGRLCYARGGEEIIWYPSSASFAAPRTKFLSEKVSVDSTFNKYQLNFAENLFRALNGKASNICSGFEALQTLKNIRTILERINL